jgi:hypothetical protein
MDQNEGCGDEVADSAGAERDVFEGGPAEVPGCPVDEWVVED